jgi:hypothetical protein
VNEPVSTTVTRYSSCRRLVMSTVYRHGDN